MTILGRPTRLQQGALTLTLATLLTSVPTGGALAAPPADPAARQLDAPIVIGHRGASGYRPEHTLASYKLAIEMGADYVEPDLVSTKDGVLVARHENEISGTTDVADHPEFADRRTTKTIDGHEVTGWFTEDFTLAELETLRAVERLPEVRPDNTRYDGRFRVPTFEEVLDLVERESRRRGEVIGVYPETKHPSYFRDIGLPLEEPLVQSLRDHGLDRPNAEVFIQSFETGNLEALSREVRVPLIQLVDVSGAEMVTPEGLREIATYADGVGANKDLVLPRNADGETTEPSDLVDDAHELGLEVHVWTLRDENMFMARNYWNGEDATAKGDAFAEYSDFFDAGVDGVFSDHPDTAVDAREEWASHSSGMRIHATT
jgi:glycerophosphoryl diester phosphodiesterase